MQKNSLLRKGNQIIRVLEVHTEQVFIIDCVKRTIPKWVEMDSLCDYLEMTEQEMQTDTNMILPDMDSLDAESKRFMYEHYTLIAGILPFVSDEKQRNYLIARVSDTHEISKKSIKNYLCLYLVYQDIVALAPMAVLLSKERKKAAVKELTQDEKNMRWALNKFFYNKNQNSLNTAYTMLLKEKYCDGCGVLLPEYPSFYQFRYFYRKTKKMQTYYISRDGIKAYQKENRPLLGDGVQEFASHVGICMLDSTVLDIYLVNESGGLVGRPLMVAAIDGYSGLCCGYSLLWEGGVYSLRGLMLNILEDKQKLCHRFGLEIDKKQWDCCGYLPATFVCDKGSEYESENFSQIAELGCTVIGLPSYRPELKSSVERFFQSIQDLFKPHLKGKGVIEPDFQERGSHDYRKDACLVLQQFEEIIVRCIVYYNSKRIIENYPYTEAMTKAQIKPFSCDIWEWGKLQDGANLIPVEKEQLVLTLLPRTTGKFSRFGLTVHRMRYKHENYTEKYLSGGTATVAYNPDDVSCVWLIENGDYVRFDLIESRYKDKKLSEVETLKESQKSIVKAAASANTQAQIDLASYIETIAAISIRGGSTSIKGIRSNRQKEQMKTHKDYMKVGATDE